MCKVWLRPICDGIWFKRFTLLLALFAQTGQKLHSAAETPLSTRLRFTNMQLLTGPPPITAPWCCERWVGNYVFDENDQQCCTLHLSQNREAVNVIERVNLKLFVLIETTYL